MTRVLIIIMLLFSTNSFAGEAENIDACKAKAKEFSGLALDEFDAEYTGNVLSFSEVNWSKEGVVCEVKLGDVYNLTIQGNQLIYKGFAGKNSYELNTTLQNETDREIKRLKSRVSLLEQRMDEASKRLHVANPDHAEITKYIEHGFEKATGNTN